MKHLSEEDLLVFHWDGGRRAGAHVEGCSPCAQRLEQLRELLRTVGRQPVPDRDEAYGREVWARLAPRLAEKPDRSHSSVSAWLSPRGLRRGAWAGVLAAVAAAAFVAGRWFSPRTVPPAPGTTIASPATLAQGRATSERVLFVDLGRHLDRSEAVLLELVHSPSDGAGTQDVSAEQARLEDLLPANRLYRQTARRAGEPALSSLLDDLERVLLDVQHGPAQLSSGERDALRHRLESEGVLFRLRIISSRVRQREHSGSPSKDPVIERKCT